jgi:metallo-beta-lactamase family protein
MQITFCGAARTVTGSQHLVEVNGHRILLDCGMYQGKRDESRERNLSFIYTPDEVDVLVLSHAHIDHSGNIPNLVKQGFTGPIICTTATADLCQVMLQDSGHIQEMDVKFVNKMHARKGEPPVEPIYTQQDALDSIKQFKGIEYEKPFALFPDVTLTFYDAGHMLGSATVALDVNEDGKKRRLVFSGDIGRIHVPILRDPTLLDRADILIMESTYGGKYHGEVDASIEELKQVILRTYERRGKVLIPAFAVERTQLLVYMFDKLYHSHAIPEIPVYVDSPLAVNVTDTFRKHPEMFDAETLEFMRMEDPDHDIFDFKQLHYIRDVEESKALNTNDDPCVIISASGMAEAGRILHHIKNNVEDERNTILFVGWQSPDTLGRRLIEKADPVRIFGEEYHPHAEVVALNGFSGHADHGGLMEWVSAFKKRPEQIFLVHGEPESAKALAADIKSKLGYEKVHIPARKDTFTV